VLCLQQGSFDQRETESRPDVLVFTTPVLKEPVEATGPIEVDLHISSDCPDTDFAVKLCDVYPDGRSMIISDGICRVRYRNGLDRVALLKTGEAVQIRVRLTPTSLVFNRGHRIRLDVAGSNYPRYDVNPNTGWPAWPFCPVRIAHNTVFCSASAASAVRLPVVRRPESTRRRGDAETR
jgi:putative CocE/NonD family hydrolase